MAKKPKPATPEQEAIILGWVADRAEWGDAEARLDRMEREGLAARDNKNARLFRPLERVVDYGSERVTWRTPSGTKPHSQT